MISVTAHHNCLAVAYRHFVAVYKLKVSVLYYIYQVIQGMSSLFLFKKKPAFAGQDN